MPLEKAPFAKVCVAAVTQPCMHCHRKHVLQGLARLLCPYGCWTMDRDNSRVASRSRLAPWRDATKGARPLILPPEQQDTSTSQD